MLAPALVLRQKPRAHVVEHQYRALLVADAPQAPRESRVDELLVIERVVLEGRHENAREVVPRLGHGALLGEVAHHGADALDATLRIPLEGLGDTGREVRSAAAREDDLALLGTNFGQANTPAWVLNLEADPHAQVEYAGTTVVVDGPFTDVDEVVFKESMKPFEEATGITVNYIGNKEFEGSIAIRVDAGDAPDIADFPQPGLMANFAANGDIVDVSSFLPEDLLLDRYNPSWLEMAMVEGPDGEPIMAGVWQRFNGKSLVWYPQAQFEAAGYEVPTTWDELMTLTQTIADDGDPAWCVGIESGAATGWVATDWMENIMLRTTSLENYDKWVTNELPFASPEVKR